MKSWNLVLIGIMALGLALVPLFRSRPAAIEWHRDTQSALERAQASKRNVLAFLYTDWCGYCRQMDSNTFADPTVIQEMGDQYVWLRLNAETDPEGARLQREHGITGYPALLILEPDGSEIDRIPGYVPPDRFPGSVRERVEAPDSLAGLRARVREDPADVTAYFDLAVRLRERGMGAQAVPYLRKLAELDTEDRSGRAAAGWFLLADTQFGSGQTESALASLAELRRRFPDSSYARESPLMEAEILLDRGEQSEARDLLARFLKDNPEHRAVPKIRELLASPTLN